MYYKAKFRKADTEFSKFLRDLKPYCEASGVADKKKDKYISCSPKLECSHFWGRVHEATRFDEENCDVLCFNHHKYFHENRKEYEKWKFKRLGKRRYDLLDVRAHATGQKNKDDELILLWLKNRKKNQ